MDFPSFYRIQQRFDVTAIDDVAGAVRDAFAKFDPADKIRPGQTVAVGVGSRGTHDLKVLVKTTVECLKAMQLKPYIIPAMGSHGGGTGDLENGRSRRLSAISSCTRSETPLAAAARFAMSVS